MKYFKFNIPTMPDGSAVSYSKDWCGTRGRAMKNEQGLLYNDRELWGIGTTDSENMASDVEELTEQEASAMIEAADDSDEMVFKGQKLADRWLLEAQTEDIPDTKETLAEASTATKTSVDTMLKTCPVCHKNVAWLVKYSDNSVKIVQDGRTLIDGVICKEIAITCPDGHRVRVVCNG
jgi:hypothetical protein